MATQTEAITTGGGAAMEMSFDADSRALSVVVSSPNVRPRRLHFPRIGDTDPCEFLADLDWGYVSDKAFGHAARQPDFLETVAWLNGALKDPMALDLTDYQASKMRQDIKEALVGYSGNDESACYALIGIFQRHGFRDDPHHMILKRDSAEATQFRFDAWEPCQDLLCRQIEMGVAPDLSVDELADDAPGM